VGYNGNMNTVETIHQKVIQLPPKAQQEVLGVVEEIAGRYRSKSPPAETNGGEEAIHPLELLAQIQIEGPPDLAERHDFYAHGKLEDR